VCSGRLVMKRRCTLGAHAHNQLRTHFLRTVGIMPELFLQGRDSDSAKVLGYGMWSLVGHLGHLDDGVEGLGLRLEF